MRYLIEIKTGKVTTVPADDDVKFYKLIAERDPDDAARPRYEQTGAHDPRVSAVELSGQDPANGEPQAGLQIPVEQPEKEAPARKG